jgi:hypothetical protein
LERQAEKSLRVARAGLSPPGRYAAGLSRKREGNEVVLLFGERQGRIAAKLDAPAMVSIPCRRT